MSHEHKGSKPGPLHEQPPQLARLYTIPSVEFAIPPSDPSLEKCHSRQTRNADAQAKGKKSSEGIEEANKNHDDEEAQSVATSPDEVTYPEGGLQAWLVVLGSFSGTVVAFGMM